MDVAGWCAAQQHFLVILVVLKWKPADLTHVKAAVRCQPNSSWNKKRVIGLLGHKINLARDHTGAAEKGESLPSCQEPNLHFCHNTKITFTPFGPYPRGKWFGLEILSAAWRVEISPKTGMCACAWVFSFGNSWTLSPSWLIWTSVFLNRKCNDNSVSVFFLWMDKTNHVRMHFSC